jgi:hypothetical protein
MGEKDSSKSSSKRSLRRMVRSAREVMKEPIMQNLLSHSLLTQAQLETLLIDLVIEDEHGDHIPYEEKAALRSKSGSRSRGVSRGAFNRTLKQARGNIIRCLYTMLLLAYLGLFDQTLFSPFEEVAARIGGYRRIRDALAGRTQLSSEELESYHSAERTILSALESLSSSLSLKSDLSRRRIESSENSVSE